MKKPNNYDNTQAQGEFIPVELGGHKLIIKEVCEMKSKTGKDMIKVSFDFSKADKQAGYFEKMFRDDIRPEKKWPNQATQYILTEDSEGNCSRSFKTFITCVEHSNKGFETQWGDNFELSSRKNWSAASSGHRWIITMAGRLKSAFFVGLYQLIRLQMHRSRTCQRLRRTRITLMDMLRGQRRQVMGL